MKSYLVNKHSIGRDSEACALEVAQSESAHRLRPNGASETSPGPANNVSAALGSPNVKTLCPEGAREMWLRPRAPAKQHRQNSSAPSGHDHHTSTNPRRRSFYSLALGWFPRPRWGEGKHVGMTNTPVWERANANPDRSQSILERSPTMTRQFTASRMTVLLSTVIACLSIGFDDRSLCADEPQSGHQMD